MLYVWLVLAQTDAVLQNHTLDANNAVVLQATSSTFSGLSEDQKLNLRTALEEGYNYLLILQDMHGKIYSIDGKLTSFSLDQDLKLIRNEADRLVQRRIERGLFF